MVNGGTNSAARRQHDDHLDSFIWVLWLQAAFRLLVALRFRHAATCIFEPMIAQHWVLTHTRMRAVRMGSDTYVHACAGSQLVVLSGIVICLLFCRRNAFFIEARSLLHAVRLPMCSLPTESR